MGQLDLTKRSDKSVPLTVEEFDQNLTDIETEVNAMDAADVVGHTSDTNNPHSVTKAQVGLTNVTDDAQLTRAAGDIGSFPAKGSPATNDILLIEDAADSNNKKSATVASVVTKANAGLGNVTNDAQMKRSNNDYAGFTTKAAPEADDQIILEQADGAKYKCTLDTIPSAMPTCGFKNKLINGDFRIWQRGTSGSTNGVIADRWQVDSTGSTFNVSREAFTLGQTDVPGEPEYYHRVVVTSSAGAGNMAKMMQRVEGVRTLAGQSVTVSFYAKADASKNMAVSGIQSFGTGGSPSAALRGITPATCALTTSWQKFTITLNIPSISGMTLGTNGNDWLGFNFWFEAGSDFNARTNSLGQQSGTFDITMVQLEAGPVATPFEQRPEGLELALCQRYFEKSYDDGYSGGDNTGVGYGIVFNRWVSSVANRTTRVHYATRKRAVPTVNIWDSVGNASRIRVNAGDNSSAYSIDSNSQHDFTLNTTATSTETLFHWTADAEL